MGAAQIPLSETSPIDKLNCSLNNASIPVTVIVAVRNEERKIANCLRSVEQFDQIFVVDSHSTDRTCEIALEMGATVVQFDYDGGWPKKRNWALKNLPVRNEWVFLLDADERIPVVLGDEIRNVVRSSDCDGYFVKWRFLFLGAWMKRSWSHGWMLRFFRHGKGEFEDLGMRGEGGWDTEVHENVVVQGCCGKLKSLLDHDNHDLTRWISKQNEFSTWNAMRRRQQLRDPLPPFRWLFSSQPSRQRKLLKAVFLRLPFKPAVTFLYLYFLKFGFLDGRAGFYFCRLRAMHELNIAAKMYELAQSGPAEGDVSAS